MSESTSLYPQLEAALLCGDVERKMTLTTAVLHGWRLDALPRRADAPPAYPLPEAGRPPLPELVHPSKVPKRSLSSRQGHAALLHAIAHIEFNAVNLALDAAWRFREMPDAFVSDWLQVAAEEARHFSLLLRRLRELGHDYGDFPAHNGLWAMSCKTDYDPLARMALVPRVLEARGLDVTPGIQRRLAGIGDHASVAVLDIILREEVGHVRIGNAWFGRLCRQRGLEPEACFQELLRRHDVQLYRGAYNLAARERAGFSAKELEALRALCEDDTAPAG